MPARAQMRSSSMFIRSRVISSSAPNGSSMSRSAGSNEKCARNRDALLHAAGQLPGMVVLEAAELDQVEHLFDPRRAPARSQPSSSSGSAMFFATVRQS